MTITATAPRLAARTDGFTGSVIDSSTSLLAQQTHDIVKFAMGAPGPDLIPTDDFTRLFDGVGGDAFGYGASEGIPELTEQIRARLAREGVDVAPERLLVTTGGMQGLDIAFKMLLDPGDTVLVEAPTYTNGIGTALSYQARILEAPTDRDGMVVEELEDLVARAGVTPKVVYTVPNFQNPSGTTLSTARRRRLVELAEEWDAVIVADDPYGALRFEGEDIPDLAEMTPDNPRVIVVRTFSKILAPGLRLGWMNLDPALRDLAVNAKQAMDTCANVPLQHMVAAYLAEGLLEPHLEHLQGVYRERKRAMRRMLHDRFGDEIETTDPQGGFFLWLTLQGRYAGIDAEELFPTALREGVAYIPGPAFTHSRGFRNALRLCFATTPPERTEEGVERLAAALDAQLNGEGERA